MEEKKIITTENELRMLIGLAAEQVCNSHEKDKEGLILDVAAEICIKVNGHLTGRKEFDSDDIELYKALMLGVFDSAKKIAGAVIIR
ncbi:hypothetical protein [uncultured Merdimonas sp.]|uniref:hypothetical protein n=1 Tax=uncultured Merdimonas sp. TaxID=2023269 RepID=UPI0032084416